MSAELEFVNAMADDTVSRIVARWRPIETAPKDGIRQLLAGANEMGLWVCTGYWFGGAWRDGGPGYIENPTHWMPLPAPPEGT